MTNIKHQLIDIAHRMWQRSYTAGNDGNLSVRLSPTRVLATPTGISKGFLEPKMLVSVDMDGTQVGRSAYKRTSEILLHLAIYKQRPDVRAVVHAHIPHATAFACSGVPLPEGLYPEAEVCLGTVPTVPYTKAGYAELGLACRGFIQADTNALLLGNHGAVTFGATLTEAYYRLEMLEAYCQILLAIKQIGQVRMLSQAELAEILNEKQMMGLASGAKKAKKPEERFFKGMKRG